MGSCGKQRVGRIIEATKADEDDYEVKVNIFIPFDNWKLHQNHFAIGEGIAKGLQEVILTTEISEFLFDRDVEDVAFVFTPEQLEEYGAILQGIDNAFVCRYNEEGGKKLTPTLSPAFPLKHEDSLCLVTQCYTSKVVHDIESLRNQIYSDLNQVSKLQGDMHGTFNRILFSPQSWDYFVLKLCGGFGLTLHLLEERLLKYRLTNSMYRTKFGVSQTVELVRVEDTTSLENLRSILGETIAYGVRAKRATLKRKFKPLKENTAINAVLVVEESAGVFKRVPAATVGGFDFIFNRLGTLAVRTRYEKVFYHTDTQTGTPLEGIPERLRELLIGQQWGYWQVPSDDDDSLDQMIQVDALFDKDGHSYQVVDIGDETVRAIQFGAHPPIIPVVFHNKMEVAAAIARKAIVEELP